MSINLDLEKSVNGLYNSLIGEDSSAEKALYMRFYAQFRSPKKVDFEPVDLCKFIFWKSERSFDIEGFFSDDVLMDELRKGKPRIPGEDSIFVHNSSSRSIGRLPVARLNALTEIISKQRKVPFFLEEITFDRIFVFDLKPNQFLGDIYSLQSTYWKWNRDQKEFSLVKVGEKEPFHLL